MSRTSAARKQAYYEGWHDARKGVPFRWERHPFMYAYRQGRRDWAWQAKPKTFMQKVRDRLWHLRGVWLP